MRLSLLEAPFFALMVGAGETYFVADAVRLGASVLELALTVALPLCAGAVGALTAILYLRRLRHRRAGVALGASVQAAVLAVLATSEALRLTDPVRLIAAACLYHMAGQFAGMLWSSWYGDLVPPEVRGRYFARRNRRTHITTFASLASAGLVLQALEPGSAALGRGGQGFACIFGFAAFCRLVSVALLLASSELPFRGLTGPRRTLHYLRTERGGRAGRLLMLGATLQIGVYIGAPYFTPFMLQELRFSYLELTLATACVVAAKFLLLPTWGHLIDARGARRIYPLALLLVALVPLPWIFAHGLLVVAFAQAFSGASWACYEITYFAVLLDATFKRTRPQTLAAQSVLNGTGQLLGSLLGASLFSMVGQDFRGLFVASTGVRLLVALVALPLVPDVARSAVEGSTLVLRTIGFRAHGGPVHRLVPAEDKERRAPDSASESSERAEKPSLR